MTESQAFGYRDAESSARSDLLVPTLFADEPSLVDAWQDGVFRGESDDEH